MSRKPNIQSKGSLEGTRDSGVGATLSEDYDVELKQFATRLRKPVLERLRAAAFHEDVTIQRLANELIASGLDEMETERGAEYEIFPPHRVD